MSEQNEPSSHNPNARIKLGCLSLAVVAVLIPVWLNNKEPNAPTPSPGSGVDAAATVPGRIPTERDLDRSPASRAAKDDQYAPVNLLATHEQEYIPKRDALRKVIEDPSFRQQQAALRAFYVDATTLASQHRAELIDASSRGDKARAELEWDYFVNAAVRVEMIADLISKLSRVSRRWLADDLATYFNRPTRMDRLRPVLTAYMNSDEQTRARFGLDVQRAANISDRASHLREAVDAYVQRDDYLSACAFAVDVSMLVEDLEIQLRTFKSEIYDKTHPGLEDQSKSDTQRHDWR